MDELLELAKNGDEKAFTELILNMKSELYGVARVRLSNEDDIDDAIQETMIIAFNKLNTLQNNEFYRTWLVKILINECNHIYRKQKMKEIFCFYDTEQSNLIKSTSSIDNAMSDVGFEMLIEKLSYEEQLIFRLYYKYNYKVKEIAYILNKNENTVKTIMRRAKEKIKRDYAGGDS